MAIRRKHQAALDYAGELLNEGKDVTIEADGGITIRHRENPVPQPKEAEPEEVDDYPDDDEDR